ncbi:MAG: SagB family peptide dehydrogenase [Trueperaceae bacterium]
MSRSNNRTNGAEIHESMSYHRGQLPASRTRVAPRFKVYANPAEVASLPEPQLKGGPGLWTTLSRERSGVAEGGRLKQSQLSQLLWSGLGFTFGHERAHTTAQEVSSLEAYVLAFDVQDIFAGSYHYNPREHTLSQLRMEDQRARFSECVLGAVEADAQGAAVCLTGLPARHRVAHGARGYRYSLLDAGAASQNLVLAATALGLAANLVTDFYDSDMVALLGLGGKGEWPLCLVTVGA